MPTWLLFVAIGVVVVVLAIGLARQTELFVLRVERGRVRVVRGRIPPKLLGDVSDVVAKSDASGSIRVIVRDGAPRVEVGGELTANVAQRLRNTVSLWPVARIRSAPRAR